MNDHKSEFETYVNLINENLDGLFPASNGEVPAAMRYSLSNGGKRIRPVLTLAFCRLCGAVPETALPFAMAAELIHTYSLIHDDLPCMDDDDTRRGRPSCHKQFGEATALLAGDALLTAAFTLTATAPGVPPEQRCEATRLLSELAGHNGMIGGQMMDLQNEGQTVSLDCLRETDLKKTGALIKAACLLGCIAAGAGEPQGAAAAAYAENLGLAFQVVDDLLDVTGDSAALGKPTGSDAANDKFTYVSALGLEGAAEYADKLSREAKDSLAVFGEGAGFLVWLADELARRNS